MVARFGGSGAISAIRATGTTLATLADAGIRASIASQHGLWRSSRQPLNRPTLR